MEIKSGLLCPIIDHLFSLGEAGEGMGPYLVMPRIYFWLHSRITQVTICGARAWTQIGSMQGKHPSLCAIPLPPAVQLKKKKKLRAVKVDLRVWERISPSLASLPCSLCFSQTGNQKKEKEDKAVNKIKHKALKGWLGSHKIIQNSVGKCIT